MQSISNRMDIEIKKTLRTIKDNKNFEPLQIPEHVNGDQKSLKITINKKKTIPIHKLDLYVKNLEHRKAIRGKTIVIPSGIHHLIINNPVIDCNIDFNEAIDLEYLEYGHYELGARMLSDFDDNETKVIYWPPNLKYLILHNFPFTLYNLPNTLIYLRLPRTIHGNLDNLPASLVGLVFYNSSSCHNYKMGLNMLPRGLRYLVLQGRVECELTNLPSNLEILNLGADEYTQTLNCLPDSVKYLTLGNSGIPITKLPNSLKELSIFHDTVDNNGIYCRDTYDILENMNFPKGFEKLIIIDDLHSVSTFIKNKIKDLIIKKNNSGNKIQLKIEYR